MAQGQREYDGDLRQLASMRAFLREICQESVTAAPVEQNLIVRLELALTEAASNIILHNDPGKAITLTIQVDDDQVRMTLQHAGQPFDPQSAAAPVFDGSRESGFGLYLIGKCVDDVHYGQDEEGRCVLNMVVKRN